MICTTELSKRICIGHRQATAAVTIVPQGYRAIACTGVHGRAPVQTGNAVDSFPRYPAPPSSPSFYPETSESSFSQCRSAERESQISAASGH